MLKQRFSLIGSIFLLAALAALPSLARAEATPTTTGSADALTRIEFDVSATAPRPRPEDLRKGGDPRTEIDLLQAKVTQDAIAKAVKLALDLTAQYPKCRFRIASITPPEASPGQPPNGMDVTMHVILLGDSGCLLAGK